MIHSASSSSPTARNEAIAAATSASTARSVRMPSDRIHINQAAALRTSLAQVDEIRPDVVARGRLLAADPSYPSDEIIHRISAAIVNSPDLSEDAS